MADNRGRHQRVPIGVAADEQFFLPMWGRTFRQYYEDVATQIHVQLKSQLWMLNNICADERLCFLQKVPEDPNKEGWAVSPPRWMDENEFFGCEIIRQENDYSWGKPVDLPKNDLIRKLHSIDVKQRVSSGTLFTQSMEMKRLTQDMAFEGCKVRTPLSPPGAVTDGIFTKAAEIRGLEQLCIDLYDDPAFVDSLLKIVAELTIERIKFWHQYNNTSLQFPLNETLILADDNLEMISSQQYERFVLPHHRRVYDELATAVRFIHLCGKAQHLFEVLSKQLGITIFNGPGPHIDLVQMLEDTGQAVEIQTQIANAALLASPDEIKMTVDAILKSPVKNRVKLSLLSYIPAGASLENITFFCKYAKDVGVIDISQHIGY